MLPFASALLLTSAAVANLERRPDQMSFGAVSSPAYFDPAPAGLTDFTDTFAGTSNWSSVVGGGAFSVAGNIATLSAGTGTSATIQATGTSPTIPNVFVQVTIVDNPSTPAGGTYDNIYVGIESSSSAVFAILDRKNNLVVISYFYGGTNHLAQVAFVPSYPMKLGLGIGIGGPAHLFVDTGSGWQEKLSYDGGGGLSFVPDGAMAGWLGTLQIGTNGTGAYSTRFQNFKMGRFGGGGIRDIAVVTNEDGTPYFSGSLVYFTATVQGSYVGVFTLDTSTYAITQTGCIYVDDGTNTLGWLPAHVVRYSNGDRRITFGQYNSGTTLGALVVKSKLIASGAQPDILTTNSSIVSGLTTLALPLGSHSATEAYDAMIAYDSANARWLCAYTLNNNNTTFWPALASSPDLVTWTLIGEDFTVASNPGYEGTKLIKCNGRYYVMAGGRTANRSYDDAMSYLGAIPGAYISGNSVTQPWPMVFNHPNGIQQILLTFDGVEYNAVNFSWGQPHIQTSPRYTIPIFSVSPTISTNTGFFGQGDIATVSYAHDGTSTTFQWLRDGAAIGGATSASYTYVLADVGTTVSCQVTGTNSFGSTTQIAPGHAIVTPTFTYDTRVPAGDMQSGSDSRLTAGDMQSGSDLRLAPTRTA